MYVPPIPAKKRDKATEWNRAVETSGQPIREHQTLDLTEKRDTYVPPKLHQQPPQVSLKQYLVMTPPTHDLGRRSLGRSYETPTAASTDFRTGASVLPQNP